MQLPRGGRDVQSIFVDRHKIAQLLKFHRLAFPWVLGLGSWVLGG
jgi:hypothetical protein